MVRFIGTDNLFFASVPLVVLAYGCYLVAVTGRAALVKVRRPTDMRRTSPSRHCRDIGRAAIFNC